MINHYWDVKSEVTGCGFDAWSKIGVSESFRGPANNW
jgi:hypothetical protein